MVKLFAGEQRVDLADLAPHEQEGLAKAKEEELPFAYAPYSKEGHKVGSALVVVYEDGGYEIFTSHNSESPTDFRCAEQGAYAKGDHVLDATTRRIQEVVFITVDQMGDGSPTQNVPYPCAPCRGWMGEAGKRSRLFDRVKVIMATTNLDKIVVSTIGVLLPHGDDAP